MPRSNFEKKSRLLNLILYTLHRTRGLKCKHVYRNVQSIEQRAIWYQQKQNKNKNKNRKKLNLDCFRKRGKYFANKFSKKITMAAAAAAGTATATAHKFIFQHSALSSSSSFQLNDVGIWIDGLDMFAFKQQSNTTDSIPPMKCCTLTRISLRYHLKVQNRPQKKRTTTTTTKTTTAIQWTISNACTQTTFEWH